MKIMEFTYTKSNGSKSERAVMVTSQPTQHVEGIDMSELDTESQVDFVEAYNKLFDEFRQQQLNLMSRFDLEHNFRKFVPEQMANIKVEYV